MRQETDRDSVATGGGQLGLERFAEERVGELDEDSRAVAGARVRAGGAAMLEVRERLERALERLVRRRAVEPCDERDAARVVLEPRVVETGGRHPVSHSPCECGLVRWGEWSGWTDFVFPFNPLIKIHGISRFHLITSQPEVKLYLSPINFDPRNLPPGFNISAPPKNPSRQSRLNAAPGSLGFWTVKIA